MSDGLVWHKHDGGPMPVPGDTVVAVTDMNVPDNWDRDCVAPASEWKNWHKYTQYAIVPSSHTSPQPTGGGSSDYYKLTLGNGERVECLDVAEALALTPSEFNVFKAVWRRGAARKGEAKAAYNPRYDTDKMLFFAQRIADSEADHG